MAWLVLTLYQFPGTIVAGYIGVIVLVRGCHTWGWLFLIAPLVPLDGVLGCQRHPREPGAHLRCRIRPYRLPDLLVLLDRTGD